MVTIYLTEGKDACVSYEITPTWRLEARFEQSPHPKLQLNYYLTAQKQMPVHTNVILEARRISEGLDAHMSAWRTAWWKMWGSSVYKVNNLQRLAQAMESQESIRGEWIHLAWNSDTATLSLFGRHRTFNTASTYLNETMRTINFQLCDDAKAQFIVEFRRLCQLYEVMNNKMRLCEQIRKE